MSSGHNRDILADAASRAARYLDTLDERSVQPAPEAVNRRNDALGETMPELPSEPEDVIALLDDIGSPATIASAGGRYFGVVTGSALPATVAANWLATA